MPKKFYMVLDCETVADARVPFDIAYTIIDREGRVVEQANYLTAEIIENRTTMYMLCKDSFSKHKFDFYFDLAAEHSELVFPFEQIRAHVRHAIKQYNATVVAYNARFDFGVLNEFSQALTGKRFFKKETPVWDLWNIALHILCNSRNYTKFALENLAVTPKGNIRGNAETVFAYIAGQPDFKEEHTALADTEIEAQILAACFKRHRKLVTEFCKPMFSHPVWLSRLKREPEAEQPQHCFCKDCTHRVTE